MPPKRERSESVASSTLADVELLMVETRAHHAFNKLMSNSPEGVAFLHGPRFSNAMKEAAIATNAAVTFNITADQAVEELRRFLALKVFLQDDKAEKLAPSSLVETMWQAAILDTQLHQELQAVLPFFVHHRPASDAEVEARKVRLVTMESVYYRFFGRNPLGVPGENPVLLADKSPRKKPRHVSGPVSLPVRLRVPFHVAHGGIIVLDGEDEAPRNNDRYVQRRLSRQFSPHPAAMKYENKAIILANNDEDSVIVLSDDEDDIPGFNARPYTGPAAFATKSFEDVKSSSSVTLYFDIGYEHPKVRATMRDTASFQRVYRQIKDRFFKGQVGGIAIWFDGKVVDKLDTPGSLKMNDGVTLFVQFEEMGPVKL